LVVYENKKIVDQLPCAKIFCVYVIGDCTITTKIIAKLLRYQISVYLLTEFLFPRCVIGSQLEGNYILREKQYKNEDVLSFAKQLVKNKIANQ